jgi:hypothetical protein
VALGPNVKVFSRFLGVRAAARSPTHPDREINLWGGKSPAAAMTEQLFVKLDLCVGPDSPC